LPWLLRCPALWLSSHVCRKLASQLQQQLLHAAVSPQKQRRCQWLVLGCCALRLHEVQALLLLPG
jgi:hypothetical protein